MKKKEKVLDVQPETRSNQIKMKLGMSYVSVDACAELLGVSKSTVYQMLNTGRIEGAFRINRTWRIPVAEPRQRNREGEGKV